MRQVTVLFVGMLMGIAATLAGVSFALYAAPSMANGPELSREPAKAPIIAKTEDPVSAELSATSKLTERPKPSGSVYFKSVDEVRAAASKVAENPSAQSYAEVLQRIELNDFVGDDVKPVEALEADLVSKLRTQVKAELDALYKSAVGASNFSEGSQYLTEAAGTLALYPMSDDTQIIREAESLSRRQNEMRFRLESIRRARYNVWAATTIENVLKTLRSGADGYRDDALNQLAVVEPSFLEPSTSALYGYAIEQLMDEYKNSEKANVAKVLNNPSIVRKTLEAF